MQAWLIEIKITFPATLVPGIKISRGKLLDVEPARECVCVHALVKYSLVAEITPGECSPEHVARPEMI